VTVILCPESITEIEFFGTTYPANRNAARTAVRTPGSERGHAFDAGNNANFQTGCGAICSKRLTVKPARLRYFPMTCSIGKLCRLTHG